MKTVQGQRKNEIAEESIVQILRRSRVGIVGGGAFCRKLMEFFNEQDRSVQKPEIIGVADSNPNAQGLEYARKCGVYTTADYTDLFSLQGLEVILEITRDSDLGSRISRCKPPSVVLIDHFHARYLWDMLQIEDVRLRIMEELQQNKNNPDAVEKIFQQNFDCFNRIISRRNARSRQIEMELVGNERAQSQIIQGSTIPTFVINKDHIVTHWNKALEKLSGVPAESVVGTNRQWAPFWHRERPTMADVILDQIDEDEIHILYGSQWRKSGLIDGAYEAEVFFPQVGQDGKWLWFTAAPIKSPDGTIVGAIETLWDKTEDKRSEEERERHTRELAALCSIYTALSAPWPIAYRIEAALKEIQLFLKADDVSIFLRDNGVFFLRYHFGLIRNRKNQLSEVVHQQIIRTVAQSGELELIDRLDPAENPELAQLANQGFLSMALVPISAKEKKSIGVLQVASRTPRQFVPGQRHVLDLIGNRIGVAIENAMLQEQYIKSEEKYRSLFNNDPNPIFIIDQQSLKILDINERAQECYRYDRQELSRKLFLELGDPDDHEMRSGLAALELGQSILFSKKRHYRKDGGTFYVNINVSRAQYGESDVLIATTTDITETIEKETQLIQASKMTTLGLMAAGMAHEINQPLNVIQICADFFLKSLRKGIPVQEKDLRSMAQDIVKNVERATGIIRHVRDFARQSEVVKSKININAPINDVFKVLGHQIKVHQIELDLDLKPDVPCIMADHNRLEQVFINLVTNAIDAMDEKAEKPEYKDMAKCLRIQTSSQDDTVVVTVADNGLGMGAEVINKIFEPFFTTKKVGKGTGLGVSISYGIVKDYDGSIRIDSQEGKGTTFILTFPAIRC